MATCKIMRRNLAMKIGSSREVRSAKDRKSMFARSTSEMFNNSNKRKDHSDTYWNDSKVAVQREENKGPLRAMRSALYNPKPAIISAASSGKINTNDSFTNTIKRVFGPCNEESTDEEFLSQRGAVATLAANRRLLKSSNGFKIFPNRRFGSSASSSCCSLFRRHDDRRRVTSFKRTFRGGFVERAYNTQTTTAGGSHSISNISSPKYLVSIRNQNMSAPLGSVTKAVQVSSKIKQELMPVDKSLRERISLKNPAVVKTHEPKDSDPMCGWHHPPSPDILSNRILERLAERRTASSLAEKAQDARTRTAFRKRRLDMQCKPMQENPCTTMNSSTSTAGATIGSLNKRISVPTQLPPLTAYESGVSGEGVSSRQMAHLTARRLTNVDQQPIRRFSLRRPPKTSLTEITPPAPGPAAESLLQHSKDNNHSSNNSPRTLTSIAFSHNQSRYSRLNNRAF